MYRVKLSIYGIIKEITISAKDVIQVNEIITNMYGSGQVQIIDIKRI